MTICWQAVDFKLAVYCALHTKNRSDQIGFANWKKIRIRSEPIQSKIFWTKSVRSGPKFKSDWVQIFLIWCRLLIMSRLLPLLKKTLIRILTVFPRRALVWKTLTSFLVGSFEQRSTPKFFKQNKKIKMELQQSRVGSIVNFLKNLTKTGFAAEKMCFSHEKIRNPFSLFSAV